MRVSDFHYDLPPELIAQAPRSDRAAAKMLHLDRAGGTLRDRQFRDFSELLRPGDLVVFNNTRVFPARLYARRVRPKSHPVKAQNAAEDFSASRIEVLLTRPVSGEQNDWLCLARPGRKIAIGQLLVFGEHDELRAEVVARGEFGERVLRFHPVEDFFARIEEIGHVPLPPYISRLDSAGDRERYQTVYAREIGSVAAPTAGLHFTPEILARLLQRGIETTEITLHVGLGTFQPVRVENVKEHKLHSERYSISPEAAKQINQARNASRRIVAVGTTTVRTLEFAAAQSGQGLVHSGAGEAALFIYPGYEFQIVDALLTNFHLPESTLLMLVCAFAGAEPVLNAYRHAVKQNYRFYSYGDCMFVG